MGGEGGEGKMVEVDGDDYEDNDNNNNIHNDDDNAGERRVV
jgi:hypothetical protein